MWLFSIPRTIVHQAPLSMGFSRQEYWRGVPFPSPGESSHPRDWTQVLRIADRFFTTEPPGKPRIHFSSVQLLSRVQHFATPWTAACQASLSITNSWSLLKLMSIESMMPFNHFIPCHPLLLPPLIFPNVRVFSDESALLIRWPKYWTSSFSISPSNDFQDWFPLGWTGWISLQSEGPSRVFSSTTIQKHQFFGAQLSL